MNISAGWSFWLPSLLAHAVLVGFIALVAVLLPKADPRIQKVKMEWIEKPPPVATEVPPAIDLRAKEIPPPKAVPPKKVPPSFGINKNTLTADSGAGVAVKAGNTLAKEVDQSPVDDALPIPVEEFLVSAMPRLMKEVRARYPEEARAKRIEGAVVLDVLVDATGRVRQVEILEGPGFGLNEAAREALRSFEFSPAMAEGKPVAVRIRYTYRFVLTQ